MYNENDVFIKGKIVYLKALSREDIEESNWYGWFNNEETTRYMQKHYFPNTLSEQISFYEREISGSTTKLQLGICRIGESKILGTISLEKIDLLNRKAEISTIIGETEGKNIKIIIEAYNLIINHAFKSLNLNRLYTGTISIEFAQLMEKVFNFKREGVLKQDVYKNGEYHDVILHGLLKCEY